MRKPLIVFIAQSMAALSTCGCSAPTVLPDDPSYSAKAAGDTAGMSVSEDLSSRVAALLTLAERKSDEMAALSADGDAALESVERSYVKLIRTGLIPIMEMAVEQGEDVEEIGQTLLARLEIQRSVIKRINSSLVMPPPEGPLMACVTAIERIRALISQGSELPVGGNIPKIKDNFSMERLANNQKTV